MQTLARCCQNNSVRVFPKTWCNPSLRYNDPVHVVLVRLAVGRHRRGVAFWQKENSIRHYLQGYLSIGNSSEERLFGLPPQWPRLSYQGRWRLSVACSWTSRWWIWSEAWGRWSKSFRCTEKLVQQFWSKKATLTILDGMLMLASAYAPPYIHPLLCWISFLS